MIDLSGEFRRPIRDRGWIGKVLLGGVLLLAARRGYFFFLALPAYGYLYRVLAARLRGDEAALPSWRDPADLVIKGVVFFLVGLGYWIVPGFAYAVSKSILEGGILAKIVALAFLAGTALLAVAAIFLFPMGLVRYMETEKFSEAFRIKETWNRLMDIGDDYFKVTLLAMVAAVALAALRALPLLQLTTPFLGFYASVVLLSLYGKACSRTEAAQEPVSEYASGP